MSNANSLTVFECGSTVGIGPDAKVEAIITAINIRFTNLQYEVEWWDGNTRKTEWLNAELLTVIDAKKTRIGFHPQNRKSA